MKSQIVAAVLYKKWRLMRRRKIYVAAKNFIEAGKASPEQKNAAYFSSGF